MSIQRFHGPGTLRLKKEKLVADLKDVVIDADALLKDIAGSTSEELVAARSRIEAKLSETVGKLRAARRNAAKQVFRAAESTVDYAKCNPWKVIGVVAASLATGVMVSYVSSRHPGEVDGDAG